MLDDHMSIVSGPYRSGRLLRLATFSLPNELVAPVGYEFSRFKW